MWINKRPYRYKSVLRVTPRFPKSYEYWYEDVQRIKNNNYVLMLFLENNDDILPKNCGQQRITIENRIIGGKEAAVGEYPWMARLVYKDEDGFLSSGCSGFLIHPYFVVTAAHCTEPYRTPIKRSVWVELYNKLKLKHAGTGKLKINMKILFTNTFCHIFTTRYRCYN